MLESAESLSAEPPLSTLIIEPKKHTIRMANHMQNCMAGVLSATIFSARTKSFLTSSAVRLNFSFSCSSRTKDFTTRIPLMFS